MILVNILWPLTSSKGSLLARSLFYHGQPHSCCTGVDSDRYSVGRPCSAIVSALNGDSTTFGVPPPAGRNAATSSRAIHLRGDFCHFIRKMFSPCTDCLYTLCRLQPTAPEISQRTPTTAMTFCNCTQRDRNDCITSECAVGTSIPDLVMVSSLSSPLRPPPTHLTTVSIFLHHPAFGEWLSHIRFRYELLGILL
ncbi:hypothetical protein F5146DRAFT_253839 [Armillaria mellea]|nr:hypothetical protein F5146DRAFT_253189 [Armillaria mellea]KAK0184263.1 hypothetical protein F5146DRAFT_253839 [Armillaria mellea]